MTGIPAERPETTFIMVIGKLSIESGSILYYYNHIKKYRLLPNGEPPSPDVLLLIPVQLGGGRFYHRFHTRNFTSL
tara:strand:- start:2026 stop:2253 length:228 start_codon:yes stop_codon:yes gene_type:complete